jgi:hypothetical protein
VNGLQEKALPTIVRADLNLVCLPKAEPSPKTTKIKLLIGAIATSHRPGTDLQNRMSLRAGLSAFGLFRHGAMSELSP